MTYEPTCYSRVLLHYLSLLSVTTHLPFYYLQITNRLFAICGCAHDSIGVSKRFYYKNRLYKSDHWYDLTINIRGYLENSATEMSHGSQTEELRVAWALIQPGLGALAAAPRCLHPSHHQRQRRCTNEHLLFAEQGYQGPAFYSRASVVRYLVRVINVDNKSSDAAIIRPSV